MAILFTSSASVSVQENISANMVVYIAKAIDGTGTGSISYSLSADSDPALSINSFTGEVTLAESPDYEVKSSYQFTVIVSDGQGASAEQTVTLDIIDVVEGTSGDDQILGADGTGEKIDGGDGVDTVTYSGSINDYKISLNSDGSLNIVDSLGNEDVLVNVEAVEFSDEVLEIGKVLKPNGTEIKLNTGSIEASDAHVTALVGGNFLTVFLSGSNLFGVITNSSGEVLKDEFAITSKQDSQYPHFDVIADADGGFRVFWQEVSNNNLDILFAAYDASYLNKTPPTPVILEDTTHNKISAIQLVDGNTFLSWTDNDSDIDGIWAKIIDVDGADVVSKFAVNTETFNYQVAPQIIQLTDGKILVAWADLGNWASPHVKAQLFDAQGNKVGSEFDLTSSGYELWDESFSLLAVNDSGFVLSYATHNLDWDNAAIAVQKFDGNGLSLSNVVQANVIPMGSQLKPAVSESLDGELWVTWLTSGQHLATDGTTFVDPDGIYLRKFDSNLSPISDVEQRVNTSVEGAQLNPSIAVNEFGEALIVWESLSYQDATLGVYSQPFSLQTQILSDNYVFGSSYDDTLQAGAGDQTIIGYEGDDNVDGGGGINTYRVSGTPDAYLWRANAEGKIVLQDLIVAEDDPENGADEGTDTLINIHQLEFVSSVTGESIKVALDDYANTAGANNRLIGFGEIISGKYNFTGDQDFFNISVTAGQELAVQSIYSSYPNNNRITIDGNTQGYWDNNQTNFFTTNVTGIVDLSTTHDQQNPAGSSSPNATQPYSFVVRRVWRGTDSSDTVEAGDTYEYLDGGLGDDILIGSVRFALTC